MSVKNILLLVFASVLLAYGISSMPVRHGDGHEYSLVSKAISNHQSPNILSSDVSDRINDLKEWPSNGYVDKIFEDVGKLIDTNSSSIHGIYRTDQDQYYGYHFWLYPSLVGLIEIGSQVLGVNPLSAFQIFNVFCLILVAFIALYIIDVNLVVAISIVSSILFGGGIYYIKWTHPELFVVSMVFIGFLFVIRQRYTAALIFFGVASMQVITLSLCIFSIPLHMFLFNAKDIKKIAFDTLKSKVFLAALLLPFSSILFYYFNYGKISLIGSGFTDLDLISFSHFISNYLDLDQGVIVGAPWLLIILIYLLINGKSISRNVYKDLCVASICSILITIPLLAQVSVNSGQSVFQRYSFYCSAPLLAWAGFYAPIIIKNYLSLLLTLMFAVVYALYFGAADSKEDYLFHKPWTNFIIRNYPNLYNPEPGIFFARSSGRGEWSKDLRIPAFVKDPQGNFIKILYPVNHTMESLNSICDGRFETLSGAPLDINFHDNIKYGWSYINGPVKCNGIDTSISGIDLNPRYTANKNEIDFSLSGFPSFVSYVSGLSGYEGWGRWSDSTKVLFKLNLTLNKKFDVNIIAGGFGPNIGKQVGLTVNGVTKYFILQSELPREYKLNFDVDSASTSQIVTILPPAPIAPFSLGQSGDLRQLGISFKLLSFVNLK